MNYDELYGFHFRIETVGVKDVGHFKNVISELRYYFNGTDKNDITKSRFTIHSFKVDNLIKEHFIPFEDVGSDLLHEWLKSSVNEDNIQCMKKDIHLMFNPPIKYYNLSTFLPKPIPRHE